MLLFLLLLFVLASTGLGFLYVLPGASFCRVEKRIIIWVAWLILAITATLICANRAVVGLIFNVAAPDVDFSQTILPQYLNLFLTDLFYAAVVIGIYLLVRKKLKIAPPLFLLALLLLSIIIYYPGIPSADGDNSYGQFLAHSYSDWQPPLFTLWWNIFHFKGITFLMNQFSYYGGLIYISYHLWKKGYRWQNDVLVLFCLNPLLFTQLAIVWKDIGFTGFFIDCVAIYLALEIVNRKPLRMALWFFYFALVFLAIGFRLNGIFPALAMIALAMEQLIRAKNFARGWRYLVIGISSLAVCICLLVANNLITYKIFKASHLYPQTFVMLSDMAYIECATDHQLKIDAAYFVTPTEDSRNNMCDPQLANQYNFDAFFNPWAGYPATLRTATTEAEAQQIKTAWLTAIAHYPSTYAAYRAKFLINDLFFQYWYPTATDTGIQQKLAAIANYQHYDMKFIFSLFVVGALFAVISGYLFVGGSTIGFYLWLSSALQLISYYLSIPAHAARYFLWNDLSLLLAIILFTYGSIKRISENPLVSEKNANKKRNVKNNYQIRKKK